MAQVGCSQGRSQGGRGGGGMGVIASPLVNHGAPLSVRMLPL